MRINKALVSLGMARSMAEAARLVKQGAIHVGGCIPPCNPRMCCPDEDSHKFSALADEPARCPVPVAEQFRCTCEGWRKATDFRENMNEGVVLRIKDGGVRLLAREDGKQGFDCLPGIGWVPPEPEESNGHVVKLADAQD